MERKDERKPKYDGFKEAPKVWSSAEGGMVYTGVDLYQCPDCGRWLSKKMTPSEEREHNRVCR